MQIETRDFGTAEINEKDIITFVKPILGFEDYTKFVMLMDQDINGFAWLQSTEEKELCFIIANPAFIENYDPTIDKETIDALGGEVTEMWLMAAIKEDVVKTTVNLKSPILFNMNNFTAVQAVSEDDLPFRFAIFGGKEQ
ncbi:MAG: flagellar assembly protein FliW [Ruminococcus sp.]|nr:flagellar assembly protein FliW [Ruminococcus sp.]